MKKLSLNISYDYLKPSDNLGHKSGIVHDNWHLRLGKDGTFELVQLLPCILLANLSTIEVNMAASATLNFTSVG